MINLEHVVKLIDDRVKNVRVYIDRRFLNLNIMNGGFKLVEKIKPRKWYLSDDYLTRTIDSVVDDQQYIFDVGVVVLEKEF